ncbi:MAG: M16 family metallopeptidase [Planctomycetota bacterium]|jgi:predicted Zn-dependent peptidase
MRTLIAVTALTVLLSAAAFGQEVPAHPRDIEYPDLAWEPPDPAKHRHLKSGLKSPVIYVVEDDSLPLVELSVHFRAGTAKDITYAPSPARMAARLLLRGGTAKETGDEIVRRVEARGGRISVSVGRESGVARMDVLSGDLPMAIETLAAVLLTPAFREEEIERFRSEFGDRFKRRNDRVRALTARVFGQLVLGKRHPLAFEVTPNLVARTTRDHLLAWQQSVFTASPLVITLAGQVKERERTVARLDEIFGKPFLAGKPPVELELVGPEGGKVHVLDRPEISQGNVRIGCPAIDRRHPDWFPVTVMNYVFGGSGFPSRITKRVRSDEGLAYSAGARIDTTDFNGGTYYVGFQTRSPLVPYAIGIVFEEIGKMVEAGATDDEMARAKGALIERFPERFSTPERTAAAFAELELAALPLDWFATYRKKIDAVTKEDVLRAAKKHLMQPGRCTVLVVGDKGAILAGDPTGAHPERLGDFGEVVPVKAPGRRTRRPR